MEWVPVLAALGLLDSLYVALQQRFGLPSFCFWGARRVDCGELLTGKHARLLGIRNSWLGMAAYALMLIAFGWAPSLLRLADVAIVAGLAMSYYLLSVQASVLRRFCVFCLTSTAIMTLIAVLAWT